MVVQLVKREYIKRSLSTDGVRTLSRKNYCLLIITVAYSRYRKAFHSNPPGDNGVPKQ